ncbi:MAG: DNA replication and repair protein RecF [Tannerella sp.]|jgi:DNA replication and repair protein RecF|nr:DNA replication and repair protein RecF [Tannerella sp.]
MILNKLHILNYKNIVQADIACSSKMNCFFGNNGMGKTNLLDAIYFLSFCKSHVHTPELSIIHRNEDVCVLQGEYDFDGNGEVVFCSIRRGQRKQFKRNLKSYDKLSEHIGLLPLVMVSPSDSELIRGGSEDRRRFMDMIISQHDKAYLHALIQYNKVLMQRNQLFRNQSCDEALFDVLEMQMEMYGTAIYEKRVRMIREFTPLFDEYYRAICCSSETVGLQYVSQLASFRLTDKLASDREKERIVGHTLSGIHKDDMEMTLDGYLIRQTGSQGQNKTCLIALKLAQFTFLATRGATKPILLLDDIFDKLDAERVGQIIRLVSHEQFGQIFITDTNRKYLDRILSVAGQDYTLYKVDNGEVTPLDKTE